MIHNRTLLRGDNLSWLKTLPDNSIDLIATDPPFFAQQKFTGRSGDSFDDRWSDIGEFLEFMEERLVEMKRVLKPTGSIYVQCDMSASHYLKVLMDKVFGKKNFKNDIIWYYLKWTVKCKHFPRSHDNILFYTKTNKYTFNKLRGEPSPGQLRDFEKGFSTATANDKGIVAVYDRSKCEERVKQWEKEGRKIYFKPMELGKLYDSVWQIPMLNPMANERLGYPTQKPMDLYKRIIEASSNKGDMVLDPFAGSGTTLEAAETLERQWIGMDLWQRTPVLALERMRKSVGVMGDVSMKEQDS